MAPSIASALREIVANVKALGLNAAADPADLGQLPGVLLYPNTASFDRLDSSVLELTVDVLLVASGVPALAALDQLDTLLAQLEIPLQLREVRAVTLNLPSLTSGGDPLPALMATIPFQVEET